MTKIFQSLMVMAWVLIALVSDHYLPWLSWHGEALAVISLFCGYLAYLFAIPRESRGKGMPASTKIVLVLYAAAVVQALFGQLLYRSELIILGVYVFIYCLSCYLGYELMTQKKIDRDKVLKYAATYIALFGMILAAEAFSRALNAGYLSNWVAGIGAIRRPGSNLAQPNHLATMLSWASVALLYLYLTKEIRAITALGSMIAVMAAMGVTESRTGLVSSLLIVLFLFATNTLKIYKDKVAVILVILAYLTFFMLWPTIWTSLQMFDEAGSSVNVTSSGRIQLWLEAMAAVAKNPIFGWGYRQFALAHMSTITPESGSLIATYAHNILIDIGIWFGLPFTLLFVITSTLWVKKNFNKKFDLQEKLLTLFLVPIGVHSLLEYPYAYSYFIIPAAFVIGALEGKGWRARIFESRELLSPIVVMVALSVAASLAYEYFRLEEDLRLARFASARVGSDPADHHDFKPILLQQLGELVAVARDKPNCNMDPDDIDRIYRVSRYYPWLATLGKFAAATKLNNLSEEYYETMRIVESYFGNGGVRRVEERIEEYKNLCQSID